MLEIYEWKKISTETRKKILSRAVASDVSVEASVKDIISAVKDRGDTALREYSAKFDGYNKKLSFVPVEQLKKAADEIDDGLRSAIEMAIANTTAFHKAQIPQTLKVETRAGVACELCWRAIENVGLYIPGGTAPLLSTTLMLAIPALLAGCKTITMCTPPRKDEGIDPRILAAVYMCGITRVLPLGGAQAIAALAFGTETVPKADKIFGPGNSYVTKAKQLVAQEPDGAAIDMPAGPSEAMVIATVGANPAWIAADLLAQAEHAGDSQAILVTTDAKLAEETRQEVEKRFLALSRINEIKSSLLNSCIIVVNDLDTAVEVANLYAPEHLILQGKDSDIWPSAIVQKIQNAGSVFVGPWSPETAGDYASGTNHVLPTYGYTKAYGSLSLLSFMKSMSVQTLTKEGLSGLAPALIALAKAEGLDGHAAAVEVRFEGDKK